MSRATQHYSHPEIELRVANFKRIEPDGEQHTTLLDLLEIYPERTTWTPELDHARLVHHFRDFDRLSSNTDQSACLRIFFIKDLNYLDASYTNANTNPKVNNTAYWMHRRFGVSLLFFDEITYRHFNGNSSLLRRHSGERLSLDGHYRFTSGVGTEPTCVWFSHALGKTRSSTYMIYQCPASVKDLILLCAQKDSISMLYRPCSVDAFIAEDSLYKWGENVLFARDRLIRYENTKVSLYTPAQVANAVENLHSLSQLLHVVRGHLTDLHERMQYLVRVRRRLLILSSRPPHTHPEYTTYSSLDASHEDSFQPGEKDEGEVDSVLDSFDFMLSKTARLVRWVGNYNERTGIRINLFFNILTQTDSKTNLDIARLTSKIAVSTQRDSSSMITMAAVTMFFLPGTFVSALFSMVFFNTQPDNSITVSKHIWLFPVVTIPLTVAVFVLWILWQRYRSEGEARSLGIDNNDGDHETAHEDREGLEKTEERFELL